MFCLRYHQSAIFAGLLSVFVPVQRRSGQALNPSVPVLPRASVEIFIYEFNSDLTASWWNTTADFGSVIITCLFGRKVFLVLLGHR